MIAETDGPQRPRAAQAWVDPSIGRAAGMLPRNGERPPAVESASRAARGRATAEITAGRGTIRNWPQGTATGRPKSSGRPGATVPAPSASRPTMPRGRARRVRRDRLRCVYRRVRRPTFHAARPEGPPVRQDRRPRCGREAGEERPSGVRPRIVAGPARRDVPLFRCRAVVAAPYGPEPVSPTRCFRFGCSRSDLPVTMAARDETT